MTENKKVVEAYMKSFESGDKEAVLSLLADDIEWVLPGTFHHGGKEEFSKEIRNENFTGDPVIQTTNLYEDGNVVIAEGNVRTQLKTGETINLGFCDIFMLESDKIKKLTSYLMNLPEIIN